MQDQDDPQTIGYKRGVARFQALGRGIEMQQVQFALLPPPPTSRPASARGEVRVRSPVGGKHVSPQRETRPEVQRCCIRRCFHSLSVSLNIPLLTRD